MWLWCRSSLLYRQLFYLNQVPTLTHTYTRVHVDTHTYTEPVKQIVGLLKVDILLQLLLFHLFLNKNCREEKIIQHCPQDLKRSILNVEINDIYIQCIFTLTKFIFKVYIKYDNWCSVHYIYESSSKFCDVLPNDLDTNAFSF